MLRVGDTIECHDQEDMLQCIRSLRMDGIRTQQSDKPHKLIITGLGEPNWEEAEE